jgi:hypothetical protein
MVASGMHDADGPVVNEKQRGERGDLVYLMAGTAVLFYPD